MKWTRRLVMVLVVLLCALRHQAWAQQEDAPKPNILWIYVEDLSPWFGCYDDPVNKGKTPVIDGMASDGVMFSRCMMPSPTCSTTRSALITGTHQGTFGLHNHRSSRSKESAIYLPDHVKTIPQLFLDSGYATFNQGKDDYNFWYERSEHYSHGQHNTSSRVQKGAGIKGKPAWAVVDNDKPWLGQIQLRGGKGNPNGFEDKVDLKQLTIPPYFPDEEMFFKEWAHQYNNVRRTDVEVGDILAQLKADGLLENTIVFFFSDHGSNHSLRHKQFCYEGGVHVPLTIIGPGIPKQGIRHELISGLDISVTTLALAGIDIPDYCHGVNLFADDFKPRDHVVSARDRCDFTIDQIRTVRTENFRYIRNGKTDRPLLQPQYRDGQAPTKRLRELHASGTLNEISERCFFGKRPDEELYDLSKDPHQVNNLANDPEYADALAGHRQLLDAWIERTGDKGQLPEPESGLRAVFKRWSKRCVNPEYDVFKNE